MTAGHGHIKKILGQAMAHHQAGRIQQAGAAYRRILEINPNHPDALHLLGGILGQLGKPGHAVALIQAAVKLKPEVALFQSNLAMALTAAERHEEALNAANRAIALDETLAPAYNHKGIALHHLGRLDEAIQCYQAAVKAQPGFANAYNNMGNAHKKLGDVEQAEVCYRKALQLQPASLEAARNLATVFLFTQRAAEAELILNGLRKQDDPEIDNLFGQVSQLQGKTRAARAHYRQALKKRPENPLWKLRMNAACPVIIPDLKSIESWRSQFFKAAQSMEKIDLARHAESLASSHGQPPYHLAYQGEDNLALKKAWADLFVSTDDVCLEPGNAGPISIAFLVTTGHEGIFLKCTAGILNKWGVSGAKLTIVGPPGSLKIIQSHLGNSSIAYHAMLPGFKATVDSIRQQRFHLVYFWEVGSDALNYFLPFFRLAPVQCTSWGTSDTTGVPYIDYYLSSKQWETMEAASHYSEKLVLLDRVPTCFEPPVAPEQGVDFGLDPNEHYYFCAQNLFKIHPDFDSLVEALIDRDPKARILLVEGKQPHWTELLKARFKKHLGSGFQKVTFLPRLGYRDYLAMVARADVLLDSIHFSGGNTSYEGLGLGTPIVTLPGRFIRGRFTYGCYRLMDIKHCIATDREDYIGLATGLAEDRNLREAVSQQIRAAQDRLFRDETAALEFEETLVELALGQPRLGGGQP